MTVKNVLLYQRMCIGFSFIASSKLAELFSMTSMSSHQLMQRKQKATCMSFRWLDFQDVLVHLMQLMLYMRNALINLIGCTKVASQKNTTRTFNLGANHRRQILCSTTGHPGSWNDMTLVLFDKFLDYVKNGSIMQDNEFEMLEEMNGKVVSVKYRGVLVAVDNGYLS